MVIDGIVMNSDFFLCFFFFFFKFGNLHCDVNLKGFLFLC